MFAEISFGFILRPFKKCLQRATIRCSSVFNADARARVRANVGARVRLGHVCADARAVDYIRLTALHPQAFRVVRHRQLIHVLRRTKPRGRPILPQYPDRASR